MCLFHLDLLNIIMIGLAKELPEHDETYELHRLLGALLSRELTIDEKLDIIGNEYDKEKEEKKLRKAEYEYGREQGREEGRIEGERSGRTLK